MTASVTVCRIVRADTQLEAEALAFLALPAEHRPSAVLESCRPCRFLPACLERTLPSGWEATYRLPTMTVDGAISDVVDHPSDL